jgi:hypothetical protein
MIKVFEIIDNESLENSYYAKNYIILSQFCSKTKKHFIAYGLLMESCFKFKKYVFLIDFIIYVAIIFNF